MLKEMNLENEKDSYILASLFYPQIDLAIFGYLYSFSHKDKGLIEIKPDISLYKLITTENNNLLKYIKLTEEAKGARKEAEEINLNSEEAKLSKEFLTFLLYAGLNVYESKTIKILDNVGIEENIIEQIKSKKDNYRELKGIVSGIEDEKTIEILEGFGVLEKKIFEKVFKEIFGESLFKAAYGYYKKGKLSKEDVFEVIGLITRSKFRHNPDIFTLKEALKKKETGCVTNAQINYLGALILGIEPEDIIPIRMTDGINRPHIVLIIKSGEKGKIIDSTPLSTPLGGKINFVSREFDLENDFEKVMDEKGRIYFQAKKDIGNPYLDLEHKRFRILPSLLAPVLVNQGEKEENIELLEMGLKIDPHSEIGGKKLLELKVEEKLKREKEAFNKLQENCVVKAVSELNGNTPEEIAGKVLNYMNEDEKERVRKEGVVSLSCVLSAIKELNHQEFTVYRKENGNGGEFYIVNNNPQKYVSITPNQRYHHAQVVEEPLSERVIEGAEIISQERWNELSSVLVGFDGGEKVKKEKMNTGNIERLRKEILAILKNTGEIELPLNLGRLDISKEAERLRIEINVQSERGPPILEPLVLLKENAISLFIPQGHFSPETLACLILRELIETKALERIPQDKSIYGQEVYRDSLAKIEEFIEGLEKDGGRKAINRLIKINQEISRKDISLKDLEKLLSERRKITSKINSHLEKVERVVIPEKVLIKIVNLPKDKELPFLIIGKAKKDKK